MSTTDTAEDQKAPAPGPEAPTRRTRGSRATSTAPTTAAPELIDIDPHKLDIGENVRDNADQGDAFDQLVASIKETGRLIVPISAVKAADGTITVRDGQRRTLAARAAGLTAVPVYVVPDTAATDKDRTIARISEQIVANDRRVALTEAQRAKGVQQLLVEGLTPKQAAKRLTVPAEVIEAAAKAAGSQQALAALDNAQLSIEQAADIIEFEDDAAAVEYLTAAETPGQFAHRVSELRQKAETAKARVEAEKPYREQGYTVLEARPSYSDELAGNRLWQLYDAAGKRLEDQPEVISAQPTHWAVWLDETSVYVDSRSGTVINENTDPIDWDIDAEDVDTPAEEGYIHPQYVTETAGFEPEYFCIDRAAAGVFRYSELQRDSQGGLKAENSQEAEKRKEAEKREKRKVVQLNKLGAAAIETRRQWVTTFLTAKTPPKGAAIFLAQTLTKRPALLGGYNAKSTAADLLGDGVLSDKAVSALPPTADARATVIILGLVLGALEDETPKDAWRRGGSGSASKPYLEFLAANGYELADVEKIITGAAKADKVYDKLVADQQPKAQAKAS
ncbi:ParB/RepB/Spo0J family partition protein [Mycobacteroides abscessus]|uniref:ParB/RepB/Spo0J family partition protein n=1 Tax=Mycobacteroides abscessus TaxID=36809 RepID=UPI0009A7B4F3|nr:ParB N-terminal domain-containing protein [Mycobacteroides abscessus]SLC86565.1 transcriptional regulator [Mycobacteroides abscessus subsp. abscessus]SLG75874.1 transcriptional regulator [Mycobacteroides abscessus subsp. abscessus]